MKNQALLSEGATRDTQYPSTHDTSSCKMTPGRRQNVGLFFAPHNKVVESPDASTTTPSWEDEMAVQWWRWAGLAARTSAREPTRRMAVTLPWTSACWKKPVRGFNHSTPDPGHRRLERRCWDENLRAHVDDTTGETVAWEDAAQYLAWWNEQDTKFVARDAEATGGRATHASAKVAGTRRAALGSIGIS